MPVKVDENCQVKDHQTLLIRAQRNKGDWKGFRLKGLHRASGAHLTGISTNITKGTVR